MAGEKLEPDTSVVDLLKSLGREHESDAAGRGKLFEKYGLGRKEEYTGTGTQNEILRKKIQEGHEMRRGQIAAEAVLEQEVLERAVRIGGTMDGQGQT